MSNKKASIFILIVLLLTGCGATSVVVDGDFPSPLTKEIPLIAGIYFDGDFAGYTYSNNKKITIDMGDSQVALFTVVLNDLFKKTTLLTAVPTEELGVDLVIVPHVEELQLSMPKETQLQVFEVWIKYNIQVFDGTGQLVADWIMTSYGKTVDRMLSSSESALNQAAIMALRDLGAQLVIQFAHVPEVKVWLQNQLGEKPTIENEKV